MILTEKQLAEMRADIKSRRRRVKIVFVLLLGWLAMGIILMTIWRNPQP